MKTARVSLLCTLLSMISCSMAGYALGHYKLKTNAIFMVLAIVTIIVPLQAYIIPLFFRFRFFDFLGVGKLLQLFGIEATINLVNGELPYYILSACGMGIRSGLFIWIFMQYFRSMPKELDDAARIDGCGEASTFIRIMLPNAISPYLVTFILSVVWYWNDTAYSSVFSTKKSIACNKYEQPEGVIACRVGRCESRRRNRRNSSYFFISFTLHIASAGNVFICTKGIYAERRTYRNSWITI